MQNSACPPIFRPETALKDLEGVTEGFEVTTVRTVVDEALGLAPADSAEEAAPAAAAPTWSHSSTGHSSNRHTCAHGLRPRRPPCQPQPATVAHTPAGDGSGTGSSEGETPPAVTSALDIKGRHTLQEIVDATGVELAALLAALDLPPGHRPSHGSARPGGGRPGERGGPGAGCGGEAAITIQNCFIQGRRRAAPTWPALARRIFASQQ